MSTRIQEVPNEDVIKAAIINHYSRTTHRFFYVCNELTISEGDRVADLVFSKEGLTTVYEVKAWNDDFRRLSSQIANYRKLFDFLYVAIAENHLSHLDKIPEDVGIVLYSSKTNKISYIRGAKRNRSIHSLDRLRSIPISFIHNKFPKLKTLKDCEVVLSTRQIRDLFLGHLVARSRWSQDDLVGGILHYEDIGRNPDFLLFDKM